MTGPVEVGFVGATWENGWMESGELPGVSESLQAEKARLEAENDAREALSRVNRERIRRIDEMLAPPHVVVGIHYTRYGSESVEYDDGYTDVREAAADLANQEDHGWVAGQGVLVGGFEITDYAPLAEEWEARRG